MKQSSRRKKGKVLQNLVRDKILKFFPHLRKKDVDVARNGENGADIKLSKVAKCLVPYSFETKNQEKMKTIYDWLVVQTRKFVHEIDPTTGCPRDMYRVLQNSLVG